MLNEQIKETAPVGTTQTGQVNSRTELEKSKQIEVIKKRYNVSRQVSMLDWERFARYYKLVRNRQITKNYVGLANLFVPEPYRIVRKKTAKLSNAVRQIKAVANEPQYQESSKLATHFLNWIRNKLQWKLIERTAIQESRITGLSWLKITWLLDKEEPNKPWKGFDLSFQAADSILIDPSSTILDVLNGTCKWLIHVYDADLAELKKNPNYSSQDLDILSKRGGTMKPDRTPLAQARIMFETRNRQAPTVRKYRIVEYWGGYAEDEGMPETQKDERQVLMVMADESILLRSEDNPYSAILDNPIPFIPIMANPMGKELFPVGDIEPAESLFNELNDTRNQRMDTVTLNIDPAKEIVRGANIDEKELVARRGWIIHSNIPGGIRFIPPDMQGVRASIEEEQAIRGDISQVTGSLDFTQGTPVEAGVDINTARGTMVAKGESDVLVQDDLEILKVSLQAVYRIVLAYAQRFLDRQFPINVNEQGKETFYNVSSQTIQGNYDLDIEMKTMQDETTEQSLKLMLLNQAKQVPGAKIGKFFTDVLEAFYDNVNITDYYEPPQPMPPESPKISISLKGDLTELQSSQIYKTIPNVDPDYADPIMTEQGREMMRGNLPEHKKNLKESLDVAQQINSLTPQQGEQPNAANQ